MMIAQSIVDPSQAVAISHVVGLCHAGGLDHPPCPLQADAPICPEVPQIIHGPMIFGEFIQYLFQQLGGGLKIILLHVQMREGQSRLADQLAGGR